MIDIFMACKPILVNTTGDQKWIFANEAIFDKKTGQIS